MLPSLVTAKLAVYETAGVRLVEAQAGETSRHARELGAPALGPGHGSHMWIIDEALAKMNAELRIDLPKARGRGKAA